MSFPRSGHLSIYDLKDERNVIAWRDLEGPVAATAVRPGPKKGLEVIVATGQADGTFGGQSRYQI